MEIGNESKIKSKRTEGKAAGTDHLTRALTLDLTALHSLVMGQCVVVVGRRIINQPPGHGKGKIKIKIKIKIKSKIKINIKNKE